MSLCVCIILFRFFFFFFSFSLSDEMTVAGIHWDGTSGTERDSKREREREATKQRGKKPKQNTINKTWGRGGKEGEGRKRRGRGREKIRIKRWPLQINTETDHIPLSYEFSSTVSGQTHMRTNSTDIGRRSAWHRNLQTKRREKNVDTRATGMKRMAGKQPLEQDELEERVSD